MAPLGLRRRPARALAAAAVALGVIAAASGAAAQSSGPDDQGLAGALSDLQVQDTRVAAIALRLALANVELCDDKGPQFGLVLHSADEYGPRLRPTVLRIFGLRDGEAAVEAVAPGGPADKAGLKPGDILTAVDGAPLAGARAGADPQAPATYTTTENAVKAIDQAAVAGPVHLSVRRAGQILELDAAPVLGCAYDTQLVTSREVNASADGEHVFLTTGLTQYAASDDDLALAMGHELAHDVMHHRRELDHSGFARNLLGNLGSNPADLERVEREADYVGLYLTYRAGYDISHADDFWLRFSGRFGDSWLERGWHPSARDRAAALARTRAEILQKREAGAPIVPDIQPWRP